MKKYYTKYIESDKPLKNGDSFVYVNDMNRVVQHDFRYSGMIIDMNYLQRMELAICDYVIKAGDKLRCYKPDRLEWVDVEFIEDVSGVVDGGMHYTYRVKFPDGQIGVSLKKNFLKVIGIVSPEATWVKAGDEFNEEDLFANGCGHNWNDIPTNLWRFQIKGPCGHFH